MTYLYSYRAQCYLLLWCDRKHSVNEGAMSDQLEPRVAESRSDVWPDDAVSMAERCENLSMMWSNKPPKSLYFDTTVSHNG